MNRFTRIVAAIGLGLASPLPLMAADGPPPLSDYGALPTFEDVSISPSGRTVAAVMTVKGERLVLVFDADRKPIFRADLGDVKVRRLDLVSDDTLLLVRSFTGDLGYGFTADKAEFYQAYTINVKSGNMESVFADDRSLHNTTYGSYGTRMVDGRPKAYFGALELRRSSTANSRLGGYVFDHGRPALYEVDLMTNKSSKVANSANEGSWNDWLIDTDGKVLAEMTVNSHSGSWGIQNRAGQTIVKGRTDTGRIGLVTIGQDGRTIIYSEFDSTEGRVRWMEVALDGSSAPNEVYADDDIDRIYTDRFTGRMIGHLEGGEDGEAKFFDPALSKRANNVRRAFPEMNPRMIGWTDGLDHVLVRTSGNKDSGTVFFVDLGQKKADAFAYERNSITPEWVGEISTIKYQAGDGLDLDGILTLPPGKEPKNLPIIMLPHGGPASSDTAEFDWWAQAFASRGYAVFQPNFRGSTHRDQAFVRMGDGEWGGKMQTDVSDGLAALADKGIVDPKRACIVGASYGGYAALAGVTIQNGLYQCAVSVNGVTDLSLMTRTELREGGDRKTHRRSLEMQLGPRSKFREISPRQQAARADAPILLIHGKDDTVVNYEQSYKMADALKDAGKPYEMVTLDGEDHWLSLAATRQKMLSATMAFVEKHNPAD